MPLTGQMKLQTTFLLPAGEADVPERLQLDGAFAIAKARFTSFNVQQRIDTLSRRGRGDTGDSGPSVVSNLSGRFVMKDGRIRLQQPDVRGARIGGAAGRVVRPEIGAARFQRAPAARRVAVRDGDRLQVGAGRGSPSRSSGGRAAARKLPIRVSGTPDKPAFGARRQARADPGELTAAEPGLAARLALERARRYQLMNDDVFKGKWMQLKGQIKEKWGQLTDDDLDTGRRAA